MLYDDAPEWLKAANAHAIAKENTSIFEDVVSTVGNAPSFAAVTLASAANSFYNTGVAVGNIFTDEDSRFEENDTGEWISSYDEDLGKYYQENKTAADLVGFIGSSFIPGTAAVKGLNALQRAVRVASKGEVGANMSLATRLLAPSMETYVKREAADLAARSATFSFMHGNSLKAVAAGAQQGVLEGLAFEAAVAATMFKSPLLEDMDAIDIVKNGLFFGVGIGGVAGILGGAAKTYFGAQKLVKQADLRASTFNRSTELTTAREHSASDKLITAAHDVELLANIQPTPEFVLAQKLAAGETGESILPHTVAQEVEKLQRTRQSNLQKLNDTVRSEATKLAKDDAVLAGQVHEMATRLGPGGIQRVFFNSDEIVRAGDNTKFEQTLKELVADKKFKNLDEARKAMSGEMVTTHIKLHSGNIGEEVAGRIPVHRLADDFDPKQLERELLKNSYKPSQAVDFRKVKDPRVAELRWIGARANPLINYSKTPVGSHDLPAIEAAWRQGIDTITIKLDGGTTRQIIGNEAIKDYLVLAKGEVLQAHKDLGTKTAVTELISDVRREFIEGLDDGTNLDKMFFAQSSYAEEASKFLGREVTPLELAKMPSYAKINYNTKAITDDAGMVMKGMELIKHRERLAKQSTDVYFSKFAGDFAKLFPELPEDLLRTLWRGESGTGLATNAGGAYGSMSSFSSYIGNLVSELSRSRINALTEDISGVAQGILSKRDDAVRFSVINAQISNSPERYVLNEDASALIPSKIRDWIESGMDESRYPQLAAGALEEIPLESPALRAAVIKHIDLSQARTDTWTHLNSIQGNTNEKIRGTFRPIRPDARDYKHVAFVKDDSLVGVGHTRMIFAKDGAELEDMIAKVRQAGNYKVYTRQEAENFKKAQGEWEFDKTLHENYIDTDLKSRGISSNFLPPTDPQKIVNLWLQQHVREENALIKQSILVKYEKETNEVKRLAEQWNLANGSRVGYPSVVELLTSNEKNPYSGFLKSMLNITKTDEYPLLATAQQALDYHVSNVWNKATVAFGKGKPTDAQVNEINEIFNELGFKSAYYDSATTLLANSAIPRGVLTGFVRKANAFLTTTILRLDAFNSLNNLVGNSILYSSELKAVTDSIKGSSAEAAGELARLGNIKLPGTDDFVFSPQRLMARAIERLHGPQKDALIFQYKERGLLPDLSDQYYKSLDALTLSGTEGVKDMSKKLNQLDEAWESFAKQGEKWTGNKWAEQFNRLLAVDTMKQITEVAVKHGIMDDKLAWMYVNTFSNRVNGVIRAAERPLMFQGPVGQAIGLFQSYQFNLLQQAFRHIGEGRNKVLGLMAGMQASVFGASSLPGFNLINSSLVGDAAGNPEHYDLFSATKVIFGQEGADWLMYGAPSNILNASLYTRGDTNPRTWHVVPNPTNPSEIPFISSFSKAFGSIKAATSQAASGAPLWNSFLSGIEHLGLSRPLAGLAQVLRGATTGEGVVQATQRDGSLSGSNDLYSLSSLIRLAGAKPIDEAIVTNAYFRINAYAEKDRERRASLGQAVKSAFLSGQEVNSEDVRNFALEYISKGGKQSGFNQWWMNQYKEANTTQAQQMVRKLDDPYARRMQEVMGGRDSLNNLNY